MEKQDVSIDVNGIENYLVAHALPFRVGHRSVGHRVRQRARSSPVCTDAVRSVKRRTTCFLRASQEKLDSGALLLLCTRGVKCNPYLKQRSGNVSEPFGAMFGCVCRFEVPQGGYRL